MARVIVCAENSVTRAGLTAMATTLATEVVGQASNLFDLNIWLQSQTADLALLELPMLTNETAKNLVQIATEWSGDDAISILMLLETWGDSATLAGGVHRLLSQILSTGQVSILPLTVSADQVRSAIAAILTGLTVLHPEIAEVLSNATNTPFTTTEAFSDPPLEPLTPREIEVLNHLAAGLSNKAIAKTLEISEHTVKFHISAILSKLGVSSRTEAVAVGIRAGLVMI
ncbi:MAG: response regulator transcription factor [Cyanobacteria bacterium J06635_15]